MPHDIHAVLRQHFGFDTFRPGQERVIHALLDGHSAAAVFPTGGGKSLCYQLPALLLPGVTVVVSPLIALMKDQIDALRARGIDARRLDSSLSADEHRDVMNGVRNGSIRILYVAPERFNNERFRAAIEGVRISLFAVDEAHCVSEWGHNFRPDYLKLAGYASDLGAERVLALTATATPGVLDDMCESFHISEEHATRTPFYRPNLTLLHHHVDAERRDALLLQRLRERPPGPTIVYVTLQRTAEKIAALLVRNGFSARPYHAGLKPEVRAVNQEAFMASDGEIVVATIAFGMGIDKADIRYVYHYNLPKSIEGYSQEIGRAGRDGLPSICETFACVDDLNVLENFIYGDTPSRSAVRSLVDAVLPADSALEPDFDVSYYDLSRAHDVRLLVVRTLLTYLELDGVLKGGTPYYSSFRFQPVVPSKELLPHFDEEQQRLLRGIFVGAQKARVWFTVDVDDTARQLDVGRERVVRALEECSERGLLKVQTQGVRNRYRRLVRDPDRESLTESLYERMLRREEADVGRLHQVVDLAQLEGCQVASLSAHFGEAIEGSCGHCSACLEDDRDPARASRRLDVIPDDTWAAVRTLRAAHPRVLAEPRSIARLLCGVSSPSLSRARLQRNPLFGALQRVPFKDVLTRAGEEW